MSTTEEHSYSPRRYKTDEELHIWHVYQDPAFREDVQSATEKYKEALSVGDKTADAALEEDIKNIENAYVITQDDLIYYVSGIYRAVGFAPSVGGNIEYDEGADKFIVTVDADISKEEYLTLWQWLQRWRELELPKRDSGRRSASRNPRLVYAIFKARQSGLTYRQIYELYEQKRLPYFLGRPTTQFKDEFALRKFYLAHDPRKHPS